MVTKNNKMTNEDLKKYDFVVLVDKSGSMSETDCPNRKSRWDYAQENVLSIARECMKYDSDGITVGIFALNCAKNSAGSGSSVKSGAPYKL